MTRNHKPHRASRRRHPGDPFDAWLQLFATLVNGPLIELGRLIRKLFRRGQS